MNGRSGMSVKVNKTDLILKVRGNRDTHRAQFEAAQVKYRERVIAELDVRLAQARNGGVINLGFRLPEPVDYTREYDAALAALEWEVEETVTLDDTLFRRLVLNEWEWQREFYANTQSYLAET